MRLKEKTAIITGGARGIGKATALKFSQEGAKVFVWDIETPSCPAENERIRFQKVDVTDSSSVERAVKEILAETGKIDILINNAGITMDALLVKCKDGKIEKTMSEEAFNKVIDVNLKGAFICTKAVAPYMIKQGYGRIISASSVVALYGNIGQTNYVASKAGIIGMTKVWARELGRYGITVNAVAPGFIETEMTKKMPEKIFNMMVERTPLKRAGKPEDVANVYLFLASDEASFINGAVISVDGGLVIGT